MVQRPNTQNGGEITKCLSKRSEKRKEGSKEVVHQTKERGKDGSKEAVQEKKAVKKLSMC